MGKQNMNEGLLAFLLVPFFTVTYYPTRCQTNIHRHLQVLRHVLIDCYDFSRSYALGLDVSASDVYHMSYLGNRLGN
jgi:hypothetical protein